MNSEYSQERVCCRVIQSFQFVAVCCSVLRCVAVCCSVLQCIAVADVLSLSTVSDSEKSDRKRVSSLRNVCVAVCCSMLQCVVVCRSVLQLQTYSYYLKYLRLASRILPRVKHSRLKFSNVSLLLNLPGKMTAKLTIEKYVYTHMYICVCVCVCVCV